jgi:hypothetical protein
MILVKGMESVVKNIVEGVVILPGISLVYSNNHRRNFMQSLL